MRHYSFTAKAAMDIFSSATNDEAEAKLNKHYPKYNPCDDTLDTPFDTEFKDAITDHDIPRIINYCLPERKPVIIKDIPFEYTCICDC